MFWIYAFGHKSSECDKANPKPEVATLGVQFKPREPILSLSGFGKCKVNPLGYFKCNIKIDDFKCNADICVVENDVMSYDVIVGMNVLMQGETVFNENEKKKNFSV
ncbi:hypothetical protein AVEN_14501-1 [Araneus ventricosus]|uniref:Uncharacterized protein n=1 Tax=Araneus ventricosus TaxID=182803 RepID=A0A4Y2CI46_ARAVE|nr:hypothetical protein AVEN_14501-1 [Araneus ventricosus]